jgi:hypothetical protein
MPQETIAKIGIIGNRIVNRLLELNPCYCSRERIMWICLHVSPQALKGLRCNLVVIKMQELHPKSYTNSIFPTDASIIIA